MKKVFFMIVLLGIVSLTPGPLFAADNSAVVGAWKCVVSDVPYEYGTSTITFAEKDGNLTGVVKFESGEEIKLSTVKYSNSQLVLTLYVEGYEVRVEGKVAGTKMSGTADTPDGKVTFAANKSIEKKN